MKPCIYVGLPKQLRIGAHNISIALHGFDNSDRWGDFSADSLTIRLDPDPPSTSYAVYVLLHEVSHAIHWLYDLHHQDSEEKWVTAQATAWTQIWRDNPRLMIWLAKQTKK